MPRHRLGIDHIPDREGQHAQPQHRQHHLRESVGQSARAGGPLDRRQGILCLWLADVRRQASIGFGMGMNGRHGGVCRGGR